MKSPMSWSLRSQLLGALGALTVVLVLILGALAEEREEPTASQGGESIRGYSVLFGRDPDRCDCSGRQRPDDRTAGAVRNPGQECPRHFSGG